MSSYVHVLMLQAFLNSAPVCPTTGHYFVEILKYYGTIFDPNAMVVSEGMIMDMLVPVVDPAGLAESQAMPLLLLLYVADPFRPEWNAAASVTRFTEIRECFRKTYEKLNLVLKNGVPVTNILADVFQ